MKNLFLQRTYIQLACLVVLSFMSLNSYSQTNKELSGTRADSVAQSEICIITLDAATRKNLIVWERFSDSNISGYNIYRESPKIGVYDKIGFVPYDSLSQFVDIDTDPKAKSNKYKISTVDRDGNESVLSTHHQTILLNLFPEGPDLFLDWTPYEGFLFDYYKIYRGTSPDSMTLLDSVSPQSLYYADFTTQSKVFYYQIVVEKKDACYPDVIRGITSSGPYSQSLSNIKDYNVAPTHYLSASASSLSFDMDGGTYLIDVFSSLSYWDVNSDQTWLTVSSDTSNNQISITADTSSITQERFATVTISADSVDNYIINVTQTGVPVSVNEIVKKETVKVYPNPFEDYINVYIPGSKEKIGRVRVYDFNGKNVISINDPDKSYISVPVKNLSSGLYIVEIVAGKTITNKMILKK